MNRLTVKEAERAFELMKSWLGAGGKPVPALQAQDRADVCLKCPMNVEKPLQELFTGAIALTVKRQIELKNKMLLRVEGEKSLHVCDGCQCILRLKTWVPISFIIDNTDTTKLAPGCWVHSETLENHK